MNVVRRVAHQLCSACAILLAAAFTSVAFGADKPSVPMTTPGAFQVTPNGSANFSVPIVVPPGIAGMEPKISIDYDSSGGPGLVGQGANVGGLSVISRCPQTPGNDNNFGTISYTNLDRFCLDGQRLVAISGTYGAANTEYRTYNETFSKIVSYGVTGNGPANFVVKTKSGLTMEYGTSSDTFIEAVGKSTARIWALRKVTDTVGNYMAFYYAEESGGDYYPTSIQYTGNAGVAQSPTNSVAFAYETRPDPQVAYQGGSPVTRTVRLSSITTYSGGSVVSRYPITYGNSSGFLNNQSALSKIQRCNALNSSCLVSTNFSYPALSASFSRQALAMNKQGGYSISQQWLVSDVDGDGKSDLINVFPDGASMSVDVHPGGSAGLPAVRWSTTAVANNGGTWLVADVNGDGRPDIVNVFAIPNYSEGAAFAASVSAVVLLNNGGTNFVAQNWLQNFPSPITGLFYLADINGDGRPELVMKGFNAGDTVTEYAYVFANTGSAFSYPAPSEVDGWSRIVLGYSASPTNLTFSDVDGDGRSDVVRYSSDSTGTLGTALISNGATLVPNVFPGTYFDSGNNPFLIDLNNDGRPDWLTIKKDNGNVSINVQINTGTSWTPVASWATQLGTYPTNYTWVLGDANSDGLPDLVMVWGDGSSTNIDVFLNSGTAFTRSSWASAIPVAFSLSDRWLAADVNGDGKSDIVRLFNDGGQASADVYMSTASDALVTAIANGLGQSTGINYTTISDSSVYTRGTGSTYPKIELQIPLKVVKSVTISDGVGGVLTTNYSYTGLRSELGTGRGSLGFASVSSKQIDTGLKLTNQYRQDWPYTGLTSGITKSLEPPGGGSPISLGQTTVTHTCQPCTFNGTPYFLYEYQRVESSNDLNGAVFPTVTTTKTFDAYGNATSVVVGTSDGFSTATSSIYNNDTANWFLGRLTRSTVTKVKP